MVFKKPVMVRNVAFGGLLALGLSSFVITAADANNGNSNSGSGNSGGANHGNSGIHSLGHNSGKSASALGALNAAHASAQAFAHASPNSRIGKIKAYFLANVAANAADAKVVADQLAISTYQNALAAYNAALISNPPVSTAVLAADLAAVNAALPAYTTATAALAADQAAAATADAAAAAALATAANKTPVSAATKAALDALLVGKIPTI